MDNSYTTRYRRNDSFTFHMRQLYRRFSLLPHIDTIGYVSDKRDTVRTKFNSYNFSFILSGTGSYQYQGQKYPVKAPCVITQQPGIEMNYGPSKAWEELFFILPPDYKKEFARFGYEDQVYPFWQISDVTTVKNNILQLMDCLDKIETSGITDRIDLLLQQMIMTSLTDYRPPYAYTDLDSFNDIIAEVNLTYRECQSFTAVIKKHGMDPAQFRRIWRKERRSTPGKYLLRLKISEACRLLVETETSISRIALELGFDDPLYFSRRFRLETGSTASNYRKYYREHYNLINS